ncbi:hypothetical protein SDC9_208544 [bioreactor metagenome]|uniref:Uncharacterized protein n=1 Tax=bioreactor metagenome TaxID=1076179 RepID=A0A645JCC2_9ZZZZ
MLPDQFLDHVEFKVFEVLFRRQVDIALVAQVDQRARQGRHERDRPPLPHVATATGIVHQRHDQLDQHAR